MSTEAVQTRVQHLSTQDEAAQVLFGSTFTRTSWQLSTYHTEVMVGSQGGGSGMVPGYPFPITTSAWPEQALAAHPNLDQNIRKAVAEALLRSVELLVCICSLVSPLYLCACDFQELLCMGHRGFQCRDMCTRSMCLLRRRCTLVPCHSVTALPIT